MSIIRMFSKKGEKISIEVNENIEEIWTAMNWVHTDPLKEEYFHRDFLLLTDKTKKVIVNKRFIYSID